VTKKGLGSRDHRQEPDAEGPTENFRVDRVCGARPAGTAAPSTAPRRPTGRTIPPLSGEAADAELALRRQLSRLQRQLADAQRELANKDDELAAEVERRLEVTQAAESLQTAHDELHEKFQELDQYKARTSGLEQRLQDAIATADELQHQLERERAERAAISTQFDEANAAFERARSLWKDESSLMAEHHASELAHADAQKRAALEAIETQMNAANERQREAQETEIAELKSAHERSVAALRGELEPKVAVARSLAEEISRLGSQLSAAKAEHMRDVTERVELHKWEMQQVIETHNAQLATESRHRTSELEKRDEELEAKTQALAQAERNATLREQLWEQTVSGLRESQKKLQQELAEAKEKCVQADASKWSVEQRLVVALASQDKANEELKAANARLEAAEGETKRSHLDRQRFVSYLEEGLAMMGAIPPTNSDAGLNAVTVPGLSPITDPEARRPGDTDDKKPS
jgi:chromosome segregation ATPase